MHTSMNLSMIYLFIIGFLIRNNSAAEQGYCTNLVAWAFDEKLIPQLSKEWYVTRATLRTLLPKGIPDPTMNNCTPMTYLETCKGAIYVEREWSNDGNVNKMTKAYSAQYDNIAEYHEEQKRADSNFFVYQSVGKSMNLHFRDGKNQEIKLSDVPLVDYALGRWFSMISYGYLNDGGKVDWVLYQDCDADFAWIEIPKYVFDNQKLLDEVNSDIDDFLKEGLSPLLVPQMVKLDIKLPF